MDGQHGWWRGLRGNVEGIVWPPALSGPNAAVAAACAQLDESQWLSSPELSALQSRQLVALLAHAERESPFMRERLRAAGLTAGDCADPAAFARLSPLTRRDLQRAGDSLYCRNVPATHRPVGQTQTSGSTGEPVVVRRTGINQVYWLAATLREHRWQFADFTGRFTAIRATVDDAATYSDWGPPASLFAPTGPAEALPITWDTARLVARVRDFGANILLAYPSTLDAMAAYCARQRIALPALRTIKTVGETLHPELRARLIEQFSVTVFDNYSSQEVGNIASQCANGDRYHVHAETLLVEVIDTQGRACAAGDSGRVLVTDLLNFATPLIRYAIGDYAEVATACPCGRGLPTWSRVLGRERNLIAMPDGTRHWPRVGFGRFRTIAPILQYQFIQHSIQDLEVRFVVERPLTSTQEDALRTSIQRALGHPFALSFSYFGERLPTDARGKFEEFICRVKSTT